MSTAIISATSLLESARSIAPELSERRSEIDANREIPRDIVERLRSMGIYSMGFSAELGGPGLTSLEQMEVVEALSYGDTATGWCAMIGSATGIYAGYLDDQAIAELMPTLDLITAGLIFPAGRAVRVPGGFRLSGRWKFGSAVTHSDLVIGGAFVIADGELETTAAGGPVVRIFVMRRDQVTLFDTWDTTGLRGSGSNDYAVDDLFVPEHHSFSFGERKSGTGKLAEPEALARIMPGVPLGSARAALDYVRCMAEGKMVPATGERWADNYRAQYILGECEMEYIVARGAVVETVASLWNRLDHNRFGELPPDARISTALARTNSFRASRRIISRLCELVGTESIYKPNPLDIWLRDVNTMATHIIAHDAVIQSAGAFLLGGKPQFPFVLGLG
ncbi:acyl-CoA dehydrogenase family protein [Nocardia sp. NBC_01503]|uniref:acyl-CoA dehydrogenase family protein n=1 Tax=Nocardia sp. NBC_01503 TaxID=2975997 RepID=UPI002E7B6A91|nr:acyl-CoA dehydrogenase family protein [Nocardia sp. NBC_01503]WTL32788.1 acyl-CoA dehydrogenase family protein [Nocardia sp. NBC_01503]